MVPFLPVSQLQLEIHSSKTAHPYNFEEFGSWWEALEESGLRAFSAELNYPAIYCESLCLAFGTFLGRGAAHH